MIFLFPIFGLAVWLIDGRVDCWSTAPPRGGRAAVGARWRPSGRAGRAAIRHQGVNMELLPRLGLGLLLSAAIGLLAFRHNSLTSSGVAGAMLVGTLIFGFGGWTWGLTLIAFFVSSSLLSHYRQADKLAVAEKFAKGERHDLGQVLANGGAAGAAGLDRLFPDRPQRAGAARQSTLHLSDPRLLRRHGHRQRRHLGDGLGVWPKRRA